VFQIHNTSFLQSRNCVIVHTPVKINLALHVTGQRADGYHLLESLVAFGSNGDIIRIEKADCDSFSIDGPFAGALGGDGDNLVLKARNALRAASGGRIGPVAIRLTKNLPVSSGLGGGSGDAAAILAGLEALMPTGGGAGSLLRCARALGADVPMCLAGIYQESALMVRGIGEKIRQLPDFPALHIVLFNPGIAVATPAVFAALENRQNMPLVFDRHDMVSFECLTAALRNARNDLYEPACRIAPVLADTLETLTGSGAVLARMSGSGATCFGIYRSIGDARRAVRQISERHPGSFTLATTTFGKKPDEQN